MAKPIFIMTIPRTINVSEVLGEIEENLNDYHCLFLYDGSKTEFEFKVFSDKEIEPIKLKKLEKIIKTKLL